MSDGWIKYYRGTKDHPLFQNNVCWLGAWMWLCESAAWKPHKTRVRKRLVTLQRGELLAGRAHLAKAWGWSEKRVRTFLDVLEEEGMIGRKKGQQITILSICNYCKYQDLGPAKGQEEASKGPAKGHTEEREEDKNKKYIRAHARGDDPFGLRDPYLADGVEQLPNGDIQLVNGTRTMWLERFDGDAKRLDLALAQAAGYIQPNSSRPLRVQVEAQLAQSLARKLDGDNRYTTVAKEREDAEKAKKMKRMFQR